MMVMIMGLGRPKIRNDSSPPGSPLIIASLCSLVPPSFPPSWSLLLIFFNQTWPALPSPHAPWWIDDQHHPDHMNSSRFWVFFIRLTSPDISHWFIFVCSFGPISLVQWLLCHRPRYDPGLRSWPRRRSDRGRWMKPWPDQPPFKKKEVLNWISQLPSFLSVVFLFFRPCAAD